MASPSISMTGSMMGSASDAGPSKRPRASGGGRTAVQLEEGLSMSVEMLQNLIIKNQSEKMALMERKWSIESGEVEEDEDPDMRVMKLAMISKRIKDLSAALQGKTSGGSPTPAAARIPNVPTSTPAALPLPSMPTPDASVSGRKSHGGSSMAASSDVEPDSRRPLAEIQVPASDDERPSTPPPKRPVRPPRPHAAHRPPSPPPLDERDYAYAEEEEDVDTSALVPPSSPPRPPSEDLRVVTPPRKSLQIRHEISRSAALAEMADLPVEAFFSSPTQSVPPPSVQLQPVASSSRQARPSQAGPSSQRPPHAPKVIKVEKKYPWTKEVTQKLKKVFKMPEFRPNQKEAIDETMAGKDVFVLMPTGGGKSLTYQLPAICDLGATCGVTFVVSPLISLILDQTRHLHQRGIPAIAYTGELSIADKNIAHEQLYAEDPWTKIVYVTPEMLTMGGNIKNILRQLLRRKRLARFVIDEAHCVSHWGHDFRNDYLRLGELRKDYPGVPIMALTATAQQKVQEDIVRTLGITGCSVLRQSFNRPNLAYEVRPKTKGVMSDMTSFIKTHQGECGIIYCSSRDKCEDLAMKLRNEFGIPAYHYHAGMTKGDRRKTQEGWQEKKFDVIVATVAFGMGIDKPDVRYVIHHSLPRSMEGYYQETGRAGRDGLESTCLLYYTFGDSQKIMSMIKQDTNLNHDQKDRQLAAIQEVNRFCSNKSDCRRVQILAFFNEVFDPSLCQEGCDICRDRGDTVFEQEDVSEDACQVIRMVEAFDREDRITLNNAVECFRGLKGSQGKGLERNPYFGCGKNWQKPEAERLLQSLLGELAIEEYYVTNRAGWSNSYLKVGKKGRDYLSGNKKMTMQFRQNSPRKQRKFAKSNPAGSSASVSRNPIGRKRSMQQIAEEEAEFDQSPWGDTDDDEYVPSGNHVSGGAGPISGEADDPIVLSGDEAAGPTKKRRAPGTAKKAKQTKLDIGSSAAVKRKPPTAGKGSVKRSLAEALHVAEVVDLVDRSESGTPAERIFRGLQEIQRAILSKDSKAPVLADETMQFIATMMPMNEKSLKAIEGMTSQHCKVYGTRILHLVISHRDTHALHGVASAASITGSESGIKRPLSAATNISRIQGFAYKGSPGSSTPKAIPGNGVRSLFSLAVPSAPALVPRPTNIPRAPITAGATGLSLSNAGGAKRPAF